jgi:hypothetical protein
MNADHAMHKLSLGYDCKVAYQIRRHSGHEQAFCFDWLMTPVEAPQQLKLIREIFLLLNLMLRFAFASTRLPGTFQAPQTLLCKTEPGADWRGDNASRDRMFGAARQLLGAPAPAA